MMSIKVSGSGLDFDPDKKTVSLGCPKCEVPVSVTLGQIQRQETVTCKNCQTSINLKDKDGSTARAVANIRNAFDELKRAVEDLGK